MKYVTTVRFLAAAMGAEAQWILGGVLLLLLLMLLLGEHRFLYFAAIGQ